MRKEYPRGIVGMLLKEAPEDRRIDSLPAPFLSTATPYTAHSDFQPCVKSACSSNRAIKAGLKISKAIFLGNVAVGKTCLINRFCYHSFDNNYKATIGVDFEVERFDVLAIPFNLQMWDTAGQERFKCIAASYYRSAHGMPFLLALYEDREDTFQVVVIVFDVTDIYSLSACPRWLEDALRANTIRPLVFLVGTKRDLMSDAAFSHMEPQAIKMARALQAELWIVSAKTGSNVDQFFARLAALTFDSSVANEVATTDQTPTSIGADLVKLTSNNATGANRDKKTKPANCSTCSK